ncbi:translation initiation factor 2 [Vibrio astriarenae]|nr:translation initiation factor 2 [Vibrio sp. C7]
MTEVTVKALSEEIGTPVERLVEQLADAGMKKADTDIVTEDEKQQLLSHLKKSTAIRRANLNQHDLRCNVRLAAR